PPALAIASRLAGAPLATSVALNTPTTNVWTLGLALAADFAMLAMDGMSVGEQVVGSPSVTSSTTVTWSACLFAQSVAYWIAPLNAGPVGVAPCGECLPIDEVIAPAPAGSVVIATSGA